MMTPLDTWVLHVTVSLLLIHLLASFLTMRRLIGRLKTEHRGVWVALGCPEALMLSLSRGIDPFQNTGTGRPGLLAWLSTQGYAPLNDPILTCLAHQCHILKRIGIAFVVALIGYGLLRHLDYL
jgi:hypothetical protein